MGGDDGVVISAQGLVKRFGHTLALDGLDLEVRRGEVHGFLGPNGAGKSTTLRALLGLIGLDGGRTTVFGLDPWTDTVAIHRRLAYVPGDVALWPNLTGGETIDLLIRMRGADPTRSRRDEMVERFRLDPSKRGRAYSKGNRQKVALIAALAAPVELLVLDEPTSGLDPLMERVFTEYVRAARERGKTVLLSSHILSEVETLCDHVSIIRAGKVVESGTLQDLRHLSRTQIVCELDSPPTDLAQRAGVHDVTVDGHRVTLLADQTQIGAVVGELASHGIRTLTATPPTLEELFLQHYDGAQ